MEGRFYCRYYSYRYIRTKLHPGMNVSLALSYNSNVWTRDASTNTMVFNGDRGFPAPGWRLGFGAIQIKDSNGGYANSVTGKVSILYLAPDGTRHDLALDYGTGIWKSYDSSYLTFNANNLVMYFPNGTQVKYGVFSYDVNVRDFQALPVEIKDRNGNFITISYKDLTTSVGVKKVIDYVTDTAGRRIDFNYQNNRLTSISQDRGGNVFYYVRLDYSAVTMKTRFAGSLTADPSNINNTQVYFPTRVTYPTGANYQFGYTSYGQISSIVKVAPAIAGQGGERAVAQSGFPMAHCIDLNAPENSPNYCNPLGGLPKMGFRTEWAENWQGGQTQNYQYTYGNAYGHEIIDPTGRRFRVLTNGMTQSVAIVAQGSDNWTKKDEATYTSDSGVSYLANLRVTETKSTALTGNGYQIKTTSFTYLQRDGMWLPAEKSENYGYRRTVMEYTSYPAQYILGLPQQVSVYTGGTLLTRVSNNYDETSTFTDSNGQTAEYFKNATADGAIQHDNTNYGFGFTTRGNLTSVTQASVVGGAVSGSRITKRVTYDTNGNVRAETDAAGNRKQVEYADNYSNKPASVGATCVYPYTTADPTGFRAGAQWNYFTGQTIKSFTLLSGSNTEQQAVTTSYDFADRPLQTNRPDGGWVKTSYWDNWLGGATSQQVDSGQVRYKFELSDGAGRAIKKASDHPDGIAGKYSGQITVYDKVGQVTDSSNVLAVDGSWIPTFEDQGKSFLFTHLTRDELSRLKIVTLPDGNSRSYDFTGCGCAGNSETRVSDELGHQTITKTDALSRLIEAIEPNASATDGIYSKATYVYDALDRLTQIQHRGGYNPNTGAVPTQFRYFSYDGYGRLASENTPEGGVVTYSYTANDQVATRSDGRNISSAYVYNNRNLPTNVSYSDGTPTVVYNYDSYGARSSVTDGEGTASYSYNSYRQLQSETRTFTGLVGNNYVLNYSYNQADQVRSVNYLITTGSVPGAPVTYNHFGATQQYPYSLTGTVRNQSGAGIGGVTVAITGDDPATSSSGGKEQPPVGQFSFEELRNQTYTLTPSLSGYVFNPQSITYQNLQKSWANADFTALPPVQTIYSKTVNYAYNAVGALSGVGTNLIGTDASNTSNVLNTVAFRASGALRSLNYGNGRRLTMGYNDNRSQPISMKVDRTNNSADKIIDYSYEYYMTDPETGASVNNNRIRRIVDNISPEWTTDYLYDDYNRLAHAQAGTYFRYYQYDPFGNIKDFSALTLNYATNAYGAPATNRIQSDGVGGIYSYDEAGNMTAGMGQSYAYDGANRLKTANGSTSTYGYDGDGMRVKKIEGGATTYYVQSSALKNTAMEVNSTGVLRAYVYANGKLTAMQATDGQLYWMHTNHLGNSRAMTDANGNLTYKGQFDPYGQALNEWSSSGNNNLNTKKFTGYERDNATGLDYANARMYNNGRGRFMTPDTKGLGSANTRRPETLNRYSYTHNDPVNFVDPTGLDDEPFTIKLYTSAPYKRAGASSGDGAVSGLDAYNNARRIATNKDGEGTQFPLGGGLDSSAVQKLLEELLSSAVLTATQALFSKPECAALFNVPSELGDAANFLTALVNGDSGLGGISFKDTGGIKTDGTIAAAQTTPILGAIMRPDGTRVSTFTGANIVINSNPNSPFLNGYGQRFGVDDATNRAITILHELGHVASFIPGFGSSILNDQNDTKQSQKNSQLVFDNCFK